MTCHNQVCFFTLLNQTYYRYTILLYLLNPQHSKLRKSTGLIQ